MSDKDFESNEHASVYVNEHLCPDFKCLLEQATATKKECDWKFVLVKNGQIFARKTEAGKRIVKIMSSSDIEKISQDWASQ